MAVAVQEAGGEIDQVEQGRRLVVEDEWGHQADRDLLVADSQAGLVAVADQLDAGAADSGGLVLGRMDVPEFGRCQEVFARDASCSRTHWITSSTPSFCRRLTIRNGRSPRIFRLSRRMTSRSAPTCGARSILLITSKSLLQMPGPPLRGILSPSATSMTKMKRSASSREKTAVRLSPPDSTRTSSSSGNCRWKLATALRLALASSRMAVWGQPPVWTPTIRSSGSTSRRERNSASSCV